MLLTPDDIFRLHPKIRWAAFSTEPGTVMFSTMREGLVSYTPNSGDHAFMEMGPIFMTGIAERLSPAAEAGKLECLIICFEKACVLVAKVGEGHLALSVDKEEALSVFKDILPKISQLLG